MKVTLSLSADTDDVEIVDRCFEFDDMFQHVSPIPFKIYKKESNKSSFDEIDFFYHIQMLSLPKPIKIRFLFPRLSALLLSGNYAKHD